MLELYKDLLEKCKSEKILCLLYKNILEKEYYTERYTEAHWRIIRIFIGKRTADIQYLYVTTQNKAKVIAWRFGMME